MAYPLHQPIDTRTGEKAGAPCKRDGAFVDEARSRADILIVDERAPFNPATHVATDSEAAEPWPFDPKATQWKLKRSVRAKTAQELADEAEAGKVGRVQNLRTDDLVTVLLAIVNEERQNRTNPAAPITRAQFVAYCRGKLGID